MCVRFEGSDVINFSSVTISEELRRKGLFSAVLTEVKENNLYNIVATTSILSNEMVN